MSTTVLIVDDHAGFRSQARALLEAEGYEVIGEAADGPTGYELARSLQPDVVLLDVQLPGMDGFAVSERLTAVADGSAPAIVLVSSRDAGSYGPRIERSGARGFVTKDDLSGAAVAEIAARGSLG
jgi:DNA-binding NarL/FixJ family response regulator